MQIFVREADRTIALEVNPDDTIDEVKRKLATKVAYQPGDMILQFAAKPLDRGTLLDYSVQKDCTLTLTIRVRGG
jgi:hypothetical protein